MAKGKTRVPKKPSGARLILADNVRQLMAYHFHDKENQPLALAKEAKCSLSTIQRLLSARAGASVDTMFKLTKAFDLSGTYQLLLPGLNPRNPQVIRGLREGEKEFYEKLERQYQEDQGRQF